VKLPTTRIALFFVLTLCGCGSRTPLDDLDSPGETRDAGLTSVDTGAPDARGAIDAAQPKHEPHPPGFVCFGDVTKTNNVTCTLTRGAHGSLCDATLLCNGDHVLTAVCQGGSCVCDNPGFDTCYCDAPEGLEDPCGAGNCCWR
jgi:hypothetical protein